MGDFTLYSAEGRQVTVPDPSGGIADAAGNFDRLLWRHRIELPILGQADPYKEVDFTSEQAAVMEFPDVSSWRDERLLRVVKSCMRIRIPYRGTSRSRRRVHPAISKGLPASSAARRIGKQIPHSVGLGTPSPLRLAMHDLPESS